MPVNSICIENDLYEVTGKSGEIVYDNRLENRFSRLESRCAELRTNIENKAFIKENYKTKSFLTSGEATFNGIYDNTTTQNSDYFEFGIKSG